MTVYTIIFPLVVEIGFTSSDYIIEEGETAVLFIENRIPNIETEITVRVDFTDGTATGLQSYLSQQSGTTARLFDAVEEDFVGSSVDVTFVPGDTQVPVAVQIIDDVVLERTEEFYATVRAFDSRVTVIQSSATVRIQDNDGKV